MYAHKQLEQFCREDGIMDDAFPFKVIVMIIFLDCNQRLLYI